MVHSVNDQENDKVSNSESKASEKEEIRSRESEKEENKGKEIEKEEEMESNKSEEDIAFSISKSTEEICLESNPTETLEPTFKKFDKSDYIQVSDKSRDEMGLESNSSSLNQSVINESHELKFPSLNKDIVNDDGADDKIDVHNDSDNTGDELTKLGTKIAPRHNDCTDLSLSPDKKVNSQKSSGSFNQRRSHRRRHNKKDQSMRSNPKAKKPSRDIPPESLPSNLPDNKHLRQDAHVNTQSLPTNLPNASVHLSTNPFPSISDNYAPNDDREGEREGGQGQNDNTVGDTQVFMSTDQQIKITNLEELENELEDQDMHQSLLTPAEIPTITQAQDEPLQPPPAPAESPPPVTHEVSPIEIQEEWLTIAVESMKTDPVHQRWIIPCPPTILCMIEQPLSEVSNESPHSTKISSVSSGDDFPT